jgi:hypothetical protein
MITHPVVTQCIVEQHGADLRWRAGEHRLARQARRKNASRRRRPTAGRPRAAVPALLPEYP